MAVGTTKRKEKTVSKKRAQQQYATLLRLAQDQAGTPEGRAAAAKALWMYNTHILPTLTTPIPRGAKGFGSQGWGRWIGGAKKKR